MSKIYLFLNGPPRCGKDTTGQWLKDYRGFTTFALGDLLRRMTREEYGVPEFVTVEELEDKKDQPNPYFKGMSYREAIIALSSRLKEKEGQDIVARKNAELIREIQSNRIVITDLGNALELQVLNRLLKPGRFILQQLCRAGKTFAGDNRRYVSEYEVPDRVITLPRLDLSRCDPEENGSLVWNQIRHFVQK